MAACAKGFLSAPNAFSKSPFERPETYSLMLHSLTSELAGSFHAWAAAL